MDPSPPEPPPGDGSSDTAALAPVPRCRLCVAFVGDAEPVTFVPFTDDYVGPVLAGVPVMASDGSTLVVIGHLPDRSTHVWTGTPDALVRRAELNRRLHLVALVHHRGRWHLFGSLDASRPYHAISDDLLTWMHDRRFADEHPHLRVTGAASTSHGIVVFGRVVANGQAIGWTQLVDDSVVDHDPAPSPATVRTDTVRTDTADVVGHRFDRWADIGRFRAREITLPLTADHVVVGPASVHDDEIAIALASDATHMLARTVPGSRGRSWTLGLMSPELRASVVFAHGRDVWLAGVDPAGGAPMVAVSGKRGFHLDRSGGQVCAAVMHGDRLVMARLPTADDRSGGVDDVGIDVVAPPAADDREADDQSSPAYIDSISAA